MSSSFTPHSPDSKLDQAVRSADEAIRTTQRAAQTALDQLVDSAQELRHDAVPMLDRAADRATRLTQSGIDAVRDASDQVRGQARRASESTVDYIRAEPVKAALIAAATGAAVMGIACLLVRQR